MVAEELVLKFRIIFLHQRNTKLLVKGSEFDYWPKFHGIKGHWCHKNIGYVKDLKDQKVLQPFEKQLYYSGEHPTIKKT